MTFSSIRSLILFKPQSLMTAVLTLGLTTSFCTLSSAAAQSTNPSAPNMAARADSRNDPRAAIVVGPRELVGKPSLGEKAAASVVGGLVGSVLGGSGRKAAQPKTRRDPSRKQDYNNLASGNFDTETQARGLWTEDGLLISSRIEDSPGKGTFQTLFLESCDGRRLYPQRYEIYDLWNESSLSVSWSSTSTSNGQVVDQQSGGWNDSWSDSLPGTGQVAGEATTVPGTWQQLGFDRAQGGVRQIGAYFRLTPAELESMGELGLFVHSTRPTQDPVTTAPAHWLLAPGSDKQPILSTPTHDPALAANDSWQSASGDCREQQGLLLASAAAGPLEASARSTAPVASRGAPFPLNLKVATTGTGQTTGHIANLTLTNGEDRPPFETPSFYAFIPATGRYQSYVARIPGTTIAPGSTVTIPVTGYCGDIHKPPVPAGEAMPPPSDWIVADGPVDQIVIPPRDGAASAGRATIPGTDIPIPRAISQTDEPLLAAPLLLAAITEVEKKTAELQASGDLQTPFSGNPEKEREAVIQQTFWIYAAELEGEPYTKEEFTQRLEQQYEDRSGIPITAAKPEDQERVQQGADDFWDTFTAVGVEAKVLSHTDPSAPATGTQAEAKAATGKADASSAEAKGTAVPGNNDDPELVAADGCTGKEHIHHTDPKVQVQIADSYGDKESRKKISEGIQKAVESEDSAYVTTTPPSTAYSLWRSDAIGGIS